MKIEFRQKNKKEIQIIGIEGKKRKVIGGIFTPSGSGGINPNAIQVCGFDRAFQLWGCGAFGKLKGITKKVTKSLIGDIVEKVEDWEQAKDIQLEYSMETQQHWLKGVMSKCIKCYNMPCTCEIKDGNKNPYSVKREPKVKVKV